ncbi:unnamed protein product [Candidula unifasciata]|uniref:SEFIR domain-containing protein n=1 Tax=Candidula unifasciata TaxID=100452 RepID=A0A8S3ZR80_9EUPU|nr:unnamed protein product [Candidula unifasciata]
MNQILKLTIFLAVCCIVRGQCDSLTVYDGGTKINTSTVCIKQFKKVDCIDFYNSFDQSLLPEEFPRSNISVGPPQSIHVMGIETPLVENSMDYMYPGLSVQWRPPFSGADRSSCYGYLIAWFNQKNVTMCQLFHINKMPQDTLRFQYIIKTVSQNTVFSVRMYSMPPSGPEWKENEKAFVSTQIATPAAYRTGTPSDWAPFVAYDILNNGTIKASISLPPAEFNITEFDIYLMDKDNRIAETLNLSTPLRTEENTEFPLSLTANSSGFYSIVVWAFDKFQMKDGLCQCWAWQNGVKTCKNTCGGTTTPMFYVNITNPPTAIPVPPTTAKTFGNTTSPPPTAYSTFTPENKPEDWAVILGAAIGVALLLALVIICIYLFRNRSRVKVWIQCFRRRFHPRYHDSQDFDNHVHTSDIVSVEGSAPRLPRKTVYLVSADDHEAHVSLVEAFAMFLEVHCHCNVILPSRRDPYETGAYEWFISSISKSDCIIFVDSKGAHKMIDAHLKKKSCTNRKVGPDGDLFIFSLKHILFSETVREQSLILVSFAGNHCQEYLSVPRVFTFPKHLGYLLKRIHRIDSSAVSSYSKVLPLNDENIRKLPEGAQLLAAIEYVKVYEESNPQYLENNFGELRDLKDVKPQWDRLVSTDSGFSGNSDPVGSVSRQGSFSGSPTAGPEYVSYPQPYVYSRGVSPKSDYKDTISDGLESMHTNMLSCYTVNEMRERMDDTKHEPGVDQFSIIPPESASEIICDSHSTAMAGINENNFEDDEGIDEDDFQQRIIPPVNPLDIQLDTVSSAFADINANADKLLLKGYTKFILDNEVTDSLAQFDAISI